MGKAKRGPSKKVAICEPGGRLSSRASPPAHLSWTSRLRNREEMNFHGSSPSLWDFVTATRADGDTPTALLSSCLRFLLHREVGQEAGHEGFPRCGSPGPSGTMTTPPPTPKGPATPGQADG